MQRNTTSQNFVFRYNNQLTQRRVEFCEIALKKHQNEYVHLKKLEYCPICISGNFPKLML